MKKFLIGLVGALSLIACQPANKTAADGYYFEKAQFTNLTPNVEIVLVQSQDELEKIIAERSPGSVRPDRQVMAFSILEEKDGVEVKCKIWILDPKVAYEPEFIGHELVHCLYGNWHTIQP